MPGGTPWANVFHFTDETVTQAMHDDFYDLFRQFYSGIRPHLNADWKLDNIRTGVQLQGTTSWPTAFETNFTTPDSGTGTGGPVPNDMAVVVSWNTTLLTRRGRGRTYVGGFVVNAIAEASGGHAIVSSTVQNALATAADTLITDTTTSGLTVYSTVADATFPVIRGSVGNLWDTQRRRERGLEEVRVNFAV